MYTIDDIQVTLLNPEEVKGFIKRHGEIACVCYNTNRKYAEKVGEHCMNSGHLSGSRANYFLFEITAPRFTLDQAMRHSVGTMINCQSQRYVSLEDDFTLYVSPYILRNPELLEEFMQYECNCRKQYKCMKETLALDGVVGEKANDKIRSLLPIGIKSTVVMGFTLEALTNFMHKRLCVRADEPIRKVAQLMKEQVVEVEPRFAPMLVAQCEAMLYCPEGSGCGKYPTRQQVEETLNKKDK